MDKKDALSRRNFIKASGMAALGAAALGLAGCGPKPAQNAANDAATSVADIAWDEEYDVIVVGAGAAGLATAVAMATEGGDLSTLLWRKAPPSSAAATRRCAAGRSISPTSPTRSPCT